MKVLLALIVHLLILRIVILSIHCCEGVEVCHHTVVIGCPLVVGVVELEVQLLFIIIHIIFILVYILHIHAIPCHIVLLVLAAILLHHLKVKSLLNIDILTQKVLHLSLQLKLHFCLFLLKQC